jgi:hypothetical protein
VLVLAFACAPPQNIAAVVSPTPSPSPTPTAPLEATTLPYRTGEVGVGFASVTPTATGGRAPYTWSVSAGVIPPGLVLGSNGNVSGIPSTPGSYTFTIQVSDAGESKATLDGKIVVAPALGASLIASCAKYCNVELGCVTVCGSYGRLSGGVPPYAYTLLQGPLPAGTSLDGLGLTGTFVGLPGYLKFTVEVTDGTGAQVTIAPTFWMYDHVSLAGGACQGRVSCTVKLPYSGGTPGPTPTVQVSSWASALCPNAAGPASPCYPTPAFSAGLQSGTATITLTYSANYPTTRGTLTVQITDNSLCAQGVYCSSTATIAVN